MASLIEYELEEARRQRKNAPQNLKPSLVKAERARLDVRIAHLESKLTAVQ